MYNHRDQLKIYPKAVQCLLLYNNNNYSAFITMGREGKFKYALGLIPFYIPVIEDRILPRIYAEIRRLFEPFLLFSWILFFFSSIYLSILRR